MDANLEKELIATRLKAVGLNHRTQSALALAELLSEHMQLCAIQQKQIDALRAKLKEYEDKSVEPANPAVSGAPGPVTG